MIAIYEWVNNLISIDNELYQLNFNLKISKRELQRWSNYIDNDGDLAKHQTFLVSLERQAKLKDVIRKLNERIRQLEQERKEIIETINKFQGLENTILKLKYVEGLKLEAIAVQTGYSLSYIKSKHATLMRMIKFSKKV